MSSDCVKMHIHVKTRAKSLMHTIFHILLKFNKFTQVLKNDHRMPGSINHLIESPKKCGKNNSTIIPSNTAN